MNVFQKGRSDKENKYQLNLLRCYIVKEGSGMIRFVDETIYHVKRKRMESRGWSANLQKPKSRIVSTISRLVAHGGMFGIVPHAKPYLSSIIFEEICELIVDVV